MVITTWKSMHLQQIAIKEPLTSMAPFFMFAFFIDPGQTLIALEFALL